MHIVYVAEPLFASERTYEQSPPDARNAISQIAVFCETSQSQKPFKRRRRTKRGLSTTRQIFSTNPLQEPLPSSLPPVSSPADPAELESISESNMHHARLLRCILIDLCAVQHERRSPSLLSGFGCLVVSL